MRHLNRPADAVLVTCFVIVVLTGAYLAFFDTTGQVFYDGPYEPLRGVEMSEAYASALEISSETPGGLLVRHLHQVASWTFLLGIVLRLVACRSLLQLLPWVTLLGLGGLNVAVGHRVFDGLAWSGWEGLSWQHGAHLLLASGTAVVLVVAWRRAGIQRPGPLSFAVVCLGVTLLAALHTLSQVGPHGRWM
ncbi:hypothetical protein [Nonomuraea dietziae]|uniref:hypothetical protein n=1 Tax=Nonomuraea dietziae TaxID=65515 RepID=UPI0033E38960